MMRLRHLNVWVKNGLAFTILCGVVGLAGSLVIDYQTGRFKQRVVARQGAPRPKSAFADSVQHLNSIFEDAWRTKKIDPALPADDLLVARRLSLALAGTIPSVEEIRHFESMPPETRLDWWITQLLNDKRTSDFLAERFARAWIGVEDGPFLVYRRRRFVSWLSDELHANRPYDQLVSNLISATGLWTDRPQVNFITRTINQNMEPNDPDPMLLAGRTSRAFLGLRIDCLQCHDDFLGNVSVGALDQPRTGTQRDFHSMAAFFSQAENSLTGIRDNVSAASYRTKLLGAEAEEAIEPRVPILPELLDEEIVPLRKRLAAWLTHSENRIFARATANRVWAILFGRGLVHPVDDIPIDQPAPAALEFLADDFIRHQFDLQRLIRLIAMSRPFTIESVVHFQVTQAHEDLLAVFPLTRLRPEQMAGAMLQATRLKTIDASSHILTQLTRFGQQRDFVTRFGDLGEDEFQDRGETVTQRLLLFNGDLMTENLENGLNVPVRLDRLTSDWKSTLEIVFLSTLSRRPTDAELEKFRPTENGEIPMSLQILDLYWSIINSAEFRWNH